MDTTSVAKETPEGETKKRGECAGCGESAGSISAGTGFPLVRDRRGGGQMFHVRCLPGTRELDAVWSGLERMGV